MPFGVAILIFFVVLLFSALAVLAGAFVMYVIKRDRRYLRFVAQVMKYSVLLLLAILVVYALQRLADTA